MNKNRDYTRYSKAPNEMQEPVRVEEPIASVEPVETEVVVETIVEQESKIEEVEPIVGIVTDCVRLNVREYPDSTSLILGVITASTELIIIEEESTDEFYKVCTSAGLEGYCMKKFVTIMP